MLTETIERYLQLRRALGYELKATGSLLRSFARFATAQGDTHIVARTAIEWAQQTKTQLQRHRRLRMVATMADLLRSEDQRHERPPNGVFCGRQLRLTPYIFTPDEIQALLDHAKKLEPHQSLRPHTYYTVFGLLATTGLRVSEALSLRIGDVTGDGLLIRQAKFHKSRLVPLHETAELALGRYLLKSRRVRGADDHVFISEQGTRIHYDIVRKTFRDVCRRSRVPQRPHPRSVRLYDFRHSYAVRALQTCPHDRARVTPHMLALSTYMGHASVWSTYWYLESTPELLIDIAGACEAFLHGGRS